MQSSVQSRHNMIDGQLEPNRVLDNAIIAAMGVVPRETFVPEAYRHSAYLDAPIPLNAERYLMEPMSFGHLLQAADIQLGHKVLVAAAGTGYSAAVVHHLGAHVLAQEPATDLSNKARQNLAAVGLSDIQVFTSALQNGLAAQGPYDRVVVDGGLLSSPDALISQLADGGILVYPQLESLIPGKLVGHAVICVVCRQGDATLSERSEMISAPLLAGMAQREGFEF